MRGSVMGATTSSRVYGPGVLLRGDRTSMSGSSPSRPRERAVRGDDALPLTPGHPPLARRCACHDSASSARVTLEVDRIFLSLLPTVRTPRAYLLRSVSGKSDQLH